MGYNTEFRGVLKFTKELTASQLSKINQMCGEDIRDHPEWQEHSEMSLTYIDLRLTKDFSGIEWDADTEKTYFMSELSA